MTLCNFHCSCALISWCNCKHLHGCGQLVNMVNIAAFIRLNPNPKWKPLLVFLQMYYPYFNLYTILFVQAGVVLSRFKGSPLSIRVLRWRAQDGTVYRPLIKPLRALQMENPALQLGPAPSQQTTSTEQKPPPSQCLKEGRQVMYILMPHNEGF